MRNASDKFVEKIKTYFVLNFFQKIVPFMRKCGKYFTAGKATNENKAHAHCMLCNSLRLCNNYCFSTPKWWHENVAMLRRTYGACRAATVVAAGTSVGRGCAAVVAC